MSEREPLYCCDNADCAMEVSYHASDLREHDGMLWCEGCWENSGDSYDEATDTYTAHFDLPKFVPESERLRTQNAALREALVELNDMAESLARDYKHASGSDDIHPTHRAVLVRVRKALEAAE